MVNNLKHAICLLLLLLCCLPADAQYDSTFVETFASKTRVNGGLRYRDNTATFYVDEEERLKLANSGLALRIGGRYKWLGYTFSIPLSDLGTTSELGRGRSLGANLELFRDKYYLNANGRRTIGFEERRVGEPNVFRDDIKFYNVLLFGFRVLNSKRFSLQSSFKQRSRQLKRAGSLLLAGAVARQVLLADSLNVPLSRSGNDDYTVTRYAQSRVGVGLGYAYTFLFGKNFFVTPLLLSGPEVRFLAYDPRDEDRVIERLRLSLRIRGRFAIGINGRHNYAALTASYLPSADYSENIDARVNETRIELAVGHRFNVPD